jgi:hypothetical protein
MATEGAVLLLLCLVLTAAAGDKLFVPYVHNWADEAGVSHLVQCRLTSFNQSQFTNNSMPYYADKLPIVPSGTAVNVFPSKWFGDWHRVCWACPSCCTSIDALLGSCASARVDRGENSSVRCLHARA